MGPAFTTVLMMYLIFRASSTVQRSSANEGLAGAEAAELEEEELRCWLTVEMGEMEGLLRDVSSTVEGGDAEFSEDGDVLFRRTALLKMETGEGL